MGVWGGWGGGWGSGKGIDLANGQSTVCSMGMKAIRGSGEEGYVACGQTGWVDGRSGTL